MTRSVPIVALLTLAATPLYGQGAGMAGNAAVQAVKGQWEMMANWVVQSAKDMPEAKYSYRPTPEVRSFGEIIGHVAGAQNMICAVAVGDTPPAEDAVEKTAKTKAALVSALEASMTNCAKAYGQSDADGRQAAELFGMKLTRLGILTLNATHTAEHYGNLVTYLRLNGMVPPSSRQM